MGKARVRSEAIQIVSLSEIIKLKTPLIAFNSALKLATVFMFNK